ncbi:Protein of unknown function [Psychroflexus salarius]|mgnify:CR=1 FL=1|jgi:hypothetical protein|uniref:DUF1573 domain-containing protein n=1 Tax=Psychroflexus salarius TaxID=1155689 RepID=A0A1M4XAQ3_9FLAO|nr:DUF1573 domain-containing protein [Psychroflexus salarius]SHE90604.1 Protein of unknown function [Psychroflexus salarius]
MKRIFLSLLAVGALSLTSCKQNAAEEVDTKKAETAAVQDSKEQKFPEMQFDESMHDFGTINEGDIVEHVFTFTNTGEAPLVITNAKGSCGCTVPTYPRNEQIMPGDKGEMTVKFNSNGKPNQQMKSIRITANTEKGTETLRIKAFVNPKNPKAGSPVK